MNLPTSALLVDLFLLEAKNRIEDAEPLRAAQSLAFAAAYLGEVPDVKEIGKIRRMRERILKSINDGNL